MVSCRRLHCVPGPRCPQLSGKVSRSQSQSLAPLTPSLGFSVKAASTPSSMEPKRDQCRAFLLRKDGAQGQRGPTGPGLLHPRSPVGQLSWDLPRRGGTQAGSHARKLQGGGFRHASRQDCAHSAALTDDQGLRGSLSLKAQMAPRGRGQRKRSWSPPTTPAQTNSGCRSQQVPGAMHLPWSLRAEGRACTVLLDWLVL